MQEVDLWQPLDFYEEGMTLFGMTLGIPPVEVSGIRFTESELPEHTEYTDEQHERILRLTKVDQALFAAANASFTDLWAAAAQGPIATGVGAERAANLPPRDDYLNEVQTLNQGYEDMGCEQIGRETVVGGSCGDSPALGEPGHGLGSRWCAEHLKCLYAGVCGATAL